MNRARPLEGTLAGCAVLLAALPLTTLLVRGTWLWMLICVVAAVVLCGVLLRAAKVPAGLVVLGQLLVLAAIAGALHLHHFGWHESPQEVRELFLQATDTLRKYAAPAPVPRGLSFTLVLLVGLLAVCADGLGATLRSPAAAGLPILATLLLSTSNTAVPLNPGYFIAVTIVWMAMVAHGERLAIQKSISTIARPTVPAAYDRTLGQVAQASSARVLGLCTLLIALVAASLVPHMAPRFLGDGLGRGTSAGPGRVSFSTTLNLANNLASSDQAPVLTYTTNDPAPPPLKVVLGDTYRNGVWTSEFSPTAQVAGNDGETVPRQDNLGDTTEYRSTFSNNSLLPPQLAIPGGLVRASLGGDPWNYDIPSGQVLPHLKPSGYSVSYAVPTATSRPDGVRGSQADNELDLPLPDDAQSRLRQIVDQLGGADDFERAMRMQAYFRGNNGFSYSLTLAPTQTVDGAPLDPLSNFLVTRRGYCVQYATAMVMMARVAGIPARLDIGFLPGSRNSRGVYQVRQADAHAWPELYFPGMGWTRFEPTPGARTGSAPAYTIDTTTTPTPSATPTQTQAPRPSSSAGAASSSTATASSSAHSIDLAAVARVLMYVVLGLLLVLALVTALPLLARRRAGRTRSQAASTQERVEAEWRTLQTQLADLGHPPATGQSPRRAVEHYRDNAHLPAEAREPLNRAIAVLERARYAPDDGSDLSMERHATTALDAARRASAPRRRLIARLWPRAGMAELRSMTTQFADSVQRLTRRR